MQIIKPRTLSLISQTYHYRKTQMAVGVLGFFRFGEAGYLNEQDGWKSLAPILQQGVIIDTGHAKACGEFMLWGDACAPAGQSVQQMKVKVQVANVSKSLQVIGDRHWNGRRFRSPSQPKPFSTLPLRFENAYGGDDFADNPLGKGRAQNLDGLISLPNLYAKGDSIKADHQAIKPACFAPLDVRWPQRQQFAGHYDQHWLQQIHPGFADDTQPEFFNAALKDQQLKGFIKPGSAIELQGLHPQYSQWAFNVPNLTARVFAQLTSNRPNQLVEASTHIDTLWLFPQLEMGLVIHRGCIDVQDSLGLDVSHLMLAYERPGDTPRELAHYEQQLALRTDPDSAATHMVYEAPLKPLKTAAEQQRIEQAYRQAAEQAQQQKAKYIEQLQQQHPDKEINSSNDDDLPPIPAELVKEGEVDLSKHQAYAQAQLEQAKQDSASTLQQAQQKQAAKPQPETLEALHARVWSRPLAASDINLTDVPQQPQQQLAYAAELQRQSQYRNRVSSPLRLPNVENMPENGAQTIRQWVEQLLANGESLAGRDLSGGDLQGLDFSQQDLRQCGLEGCDLQHCCFNGANLTGAILTDSNIAGATFCSATLHHCNLSQCRGQGTDFSGAELNDVLMMDSEFEGARFSQAKLTKVQALKACFDQALFEHTELLQCQFMLATLAGSQWRQCSLQIGNFSKADLSHSHWQECRLYRCVMVDLKADKIEHIQTKAEKVQFSNQGQLSSAKFEACQWHTCGFRDLDLTQSQCTNSVFEQCDLGGTQLQQSCIQHCVFNHCILLLADFSHSQLRQVLFCQGRLNKSLFVSSELTEVKFINCSTTEMNSQEARFIRCQTSPMPSIAS